MPKSHLKLIPRQDKYGASKSQRAQRQLSWALHITEGFAANMAVAAKHELSSTEREILKAISASATAWANVIRSKL